MRGGSSGEGGCVLGLQGGTEGEGGAPYYMRGSRRSVVCLATCNSMQKASGSWLVSHQPPPLTPPLPVAQAEERAGGGL